MRNLVAILFFLLVGILLLCLAIYMIVQSWKTKRYWEAEWHKIEVRKELNRLIVAKYGPQSRLMTGDDEISQAIIDRYCLAETNDHPSETPEEKERWPSGYRKWLCGPMPPTYDEIQRTDGTWHLRYFKKNLDENGNPKDVWDYVGVHNIGADEFIEGLDQMFKEAEENEKRMKEAKEQAEERANKMIKERDDKEPDKETLEKRNVI